MSILDVVLGFKNVLLEARRSIVYRSTLLDELLLFDNYASGRYADFGYLKFK